MTWILVWIIDSPVLLNWQIKVIDQNIAAERGHWRICPNESHFHVHRRLDKGTSKSVQKGYINQRPKAQMQWCPIYFSFSNEQIEGRFVSPIEHLVNIHPSKSLFVIRRWSWISGRKQRIAFASKRLAAVDDHCFHCCCGRIECIGRIFLPGRVEPLFEILRNQQSGRCDNRSRHGRSRFWNDSTARFVRPARCCRVNGDSRSHNVWLDSLVGSGSLTWEGGANIGIIRTVVHGADAQNILSVGGREDCAHATRWGRRTAENPFSPSFPAANTRKQSGCSYL